MFLCLSTIHINIACAGTSSEEAKMFPPSKEDNTACSNSEVSVITWALEKPSTKCISVEAYIVAAMNKAGCTPGQVLALGDDGKSIVCK